MQESKISISFSKPCKESSQLPFMMVIREYWEDGEVVFAEVIRSFDNIWDLENFTFPELVQNIQEDPLWVIPRE